MKKILTTLLFTIAATPLIAANNYQNLESKTINTSYKGKNISYVVPAMTSDQQFQVDQIIKASHKNGNKLSQTQINYLDQFKVEFKGDKTKKLKGLTCVALLTRPSWEAYNNCPRNIGFTLALLNQKTRVPLVFRAKVTPQHFYATGFTYPIYIVQGLRIKPGLDTYFI
jgi:hypothetical protein